MLGYIIRNASGIRVQRNGNNIRVYTSGSVVESVDGASPEGAYVTVYDVAVGDLQTLMNSPTDTVTISTNANVVTQFHPNADGGFDASANQPLEHSFLLVAVTSSSDSRVVELTHSDNTSAKAAFGLSTVIDGFLPMYRTPIGDREWGTKNSFGTLNAGRSITGMDGEGQAHVLSILYNPTSTQLMTWRNRLGAWTSPEEIVSFPNGTDIINPVVAVSEMGNAVVCFVKEDGASSHVGASYFVKELNQWSVPVEFEPTSNSDSAHCHIDSEGNAAVLYRGEIPLGGGSKIVVRSLSPPVIDWSDSYIVETGAAAVDVAYGKVNFWAPESLVVVWWSSDHVANRRRVEGTWGAIYSGSNTMGPIKDLLLAQMSTGDSLVIEEHTALSGEATELIATDISPTGGFGIPSTIARYGNDARLAMSAEGNAVVAFDVVDVIGPQSSVSLQAMKWAISSGWDQAPTLLRGGVDTYTVSLGSAVVDREGNILLSYIDRLSIAEPSSGRVHRYSAYSRTWDVTTISGATAEALRILSLSLAPQTVSPIFRGIVAWFESGMVWYSFFE